MFRVFLLFRFHFSINISANIIDSEDYFEIFDEKLFLSTNEDLGSRFDISAKLLSKMRSRNQCLYREASTCPAVLSDIQFIRDWQITRVRQGGGRGVEYRVYES